VVEVQVQLRKVVLIDLEHEIVLVTQIWSDRPAFLCTRVVGLKSQDASPVQIFENYQRLFPQLLQLQLRGL